MNSPRSHPPFVPSALLVALPLFSCTGFAVPSRVRRQRHCRRFLQDRTVCMLVGGSVGFAVGGLNWCARQLEVRPALNPPEQVL
jgi:hypothetical protein